VFPTLVEKLNADPLLKDRGTLAGMTSPSRTLEEYRKLNDPKMLERSSDIEWLGVTKARTENDVGRKRWNSPRPESGSGRYKIALSAYSKGTAMPHPLPTPSRTCYTRAPPIRSAAIKQLIYRSQPFGFDQSVLDGILMAARRNNARSGITGALICRQDMYIQLVEGPDEAIDALYQRILLDDRHTQVTLESSAMIEERMFPDWAMYADTNPSMTFSQAQVDDGEIERASSDVVRALFRQIAERAREAGPADQASG
jgi:hypothetical protein